MRDESQEPTHLSSVELESTIRRLGSRDAVVRAEAERIVKGTGVEAIEPLVAVLHRERATSSTRRAFGSAIMLSAFLCAIGLLTGISELSLIAIGIDFLICLLSVFIARSLWNFMESSRLQKRAAAMVLEIKDERAVGPLIDILNSPFLAENTQVRRVLLPLLHRMRASDAALLQERHREHFRYVLRHWERFQYGPQYDTDYIIAVLVALQQIGDARDLPAVERISCSDPTLHVAGPALQQTGRDCRSTHGFISDRMAREAYKPPIIRAALEALPYLRQKAEQQLVSNSLLRASGSVAATADGLLRAAMSGAATEPTELLRPNPLIETERLR